MENQNDIHRELTSLPVGKLLWKYSVPAIVGTMVMSLYNVIDRIFIGQGVGADAISGLALTFPIMSLAGAIGMLVGLGASARISIVLGQNDKVKAEKFWQTVLYFRSRLPFVTLPSSRFTWTIYCAVSAAATAPFHMPESFSSTSCRVCSAPIFVIVSTI